MQICRKRKIFQRLTDIQFYLLEPTQTPKTTNMTSSTRSDKESHNASGDSHRHTARRIGASIATARAGGVSCCAQLRHKAG